MGGGPFVGLAAPIAAFTAIKRRRAKRARTRSAAEGRSASGGWLSLAILVRDAKARERRRKIARAQPLPAETLAVRFAVQKAVGAALSDNADLMSTG